MRISDWSSDVCSSDLYGPANADQDFHVAVAKFSRNSLLFNMLTREYYPLIRIFRVHHKWVRGRALRALEEHRRIVDAIIDRSEEHTYELPSLMSIYYDVFCFKKTKTPTTQTTHLLYN